MLRPVLLALLVVGGLAATPVAASGSYLATDGPESPRAADVTVLAIDGAARTNVTSPTLDVAAAVAAQRERARAELFHRSLAAGVEGAGDDATRRERIEAAATETERAVASLRSSRRDLWASVAAGDVTLSTYLARETVLESRAAALRSDLEAVREVAESVPGTSMRSRVREIGAGLTGFGGPVATRAADAVTGETRPAPVYVSVTPNGTALATVVDEEYVRQGLRTDRWDPESTGGMSLDDLETRAAEIYPEAFDSNRTTSRGIQVVGAGVYRIEIGYDEGTILAFLDGDTRDVFYEIQRRPLDLARPGPAVTAIDNGTRLAVNRTFAGGPLRVSVVSDRTGEPVDATVSVAGTTTTTGHDGVVWAVMPGERARVTVTTPGGRNTVVVAASPLPAG